MDDKSALLDQLRIDVPPETETEVAARWPLWTTALAGAARQVRRHANESGRPAAAAWRPVW